MRWCATTVGEALIIVLLAVMPLTGSPDSSPSITIQIVAPWKVYVQVNDVKRRNVIDRTHVFRVKPSQATAVTDEQVASVPVYNPVADRWFRGLGPGGIKACELTQPGALDPSSFSMRATNGVRLKRGVDYDLDDDWGVFGSLRGGALKPGEPAVISYRYYPQRLDSVFLAADGSLAYREGVPRVSTPLPPALPDGARRLANIWINSGKLQALRAANIFAITEHEVPHSLELHLDRVRTLMPVTVAKLERGQLITVLAWGDSVTTGPCLPSPKMSWQYTFVDRLQSIYPKAHITLRTEAWPAHNTQSYLDAPPGDAHNFRDRVLAVHPDVVISEFVNDAKLSSVETTARYASLLAQFRSIHAEWIILTPAYTSLWMGDTTWKGAVDEHNLDTDPRPYVTALREFANVNRVVIADGSMRWGRLWREGLPYTTLLANSINHPDSRGHEIYVDSLLALFTK